MGKLVLYLPDGTLHDIPLDKERVSIGRRPDNDVCLPYPAVSGEHAAVVNILADSFLEDLGSTNGTLVNGKPIVKHFLRDNDLIDIGRQRLMYFSDLNHKAEPLPPDVLRREIMGLHEQVERARVVREEKPPKPLAGPGGNGPRTVDPLIPDDELLADLEPAAFPAVKKVAPPSVARRPRASGDPASFEGTARRSRESGDPASFEGTGRRPRESGDPASLKRKDPSAVATRLASTWEAPAAAPPPKSNETAAARVAPAATARYAVRVLSGPNAGRELPITRDEFSVGRVGTQVARIVGRDGRYRLARVEGSDPVMLNGAAVPEDGATITPGDHFVVAGIELAFERR